MTAKLIVIVSVAQINGLVSSAHKTVGITIENMTSAPPMVGVPALLK